jgi:hypothetical protein
MIQTDDRFGRVSVLCGFQVLCELPRVLWLIPKMANLLSKWKAAVLFKAQWIYNPPEDE